MPFVTPKLIRAMGERRGRGVFAETAEGAGFPFALGRECLPLVEQALAEQRFSLQALARRLRARKLRLPRRRRDELLNLNTPEDFARALVSARANALAWPGGAE
jgi:CTP:molybdopterin cytidylyltransferase MocA